MKRKTIIVLLALLTLLLCACGNKETPTEDFAFEMVDGEITITGYLGTEREIVIPEEINDRPVTVIAEGAFHEYDLLSIEFPEYLRVIETNAFSGCNCLTTVSFPAGLKEIEDGAFWSCESLTEVKLPDGLEYLGEDAFGACDSLISLEIPEDFEGFKIEVRFVSAEVTESGRKENYKEMILSPVSTNTVLLIQEGSKAESLLEIYSDGKINFMVLGKETAQDNSVVVYLVEEKCTFNSEDVMTQRIRYTYDEKGNVLTEEVDNGESTEIWNEELMVYEYLKGKVDGTIDQTNTWTYDMFCNVLTKAYKGHSNGSETYQYTYENGLSTRQTIPNNTKDYTEFYYNENGQLVRQLTYRMEYKEPDEFSFEYTSDGNLGKIKWGDGTEFVFSYNDRTELTELTRTYEGTQNFRNVYEYDSEGRMTVKESYNENNELEQRSEYIYNREGLLEEEIITSIDYGEEVRSTVKYTYDKLKMSEREAESYQARMQWRWLMEQTGVDYLFIK